MKKRKSLRFAAIIAAIFFGSLCTFSISTYARELIYQNTEKKDLANGITYYNITRLLSDKWLDIHVVEAELDNPNVQIRLLKDEKGVNWLNDVKELTDQSECVAGINGDFFQWNKYLAGTGSALSMESSDGEFLSSPGLDSSMSTFVIREHQPPSVGFFDFYVTITAPNQNKSTIKLVNKYHDLSTMVIYTPQWGGGLVNDPGVYHMVVENDVVVSMGHYDQLTTSVGWGPSNEFRSIPDNGYVISVLTDYDPFLKNNFAVGDVVQLSTFASPSIGNIEMSIGGGAVLLNNGQKPAKFNHDMTGVHPRTALGFNDTHVYLVAVDGRQKMSGGMTQDELADFMKELGADCAINLDGGGSTTMAVRSVWEQTSKIVNSPSDGDARRVVNGVGIKALNIDEVEQPPPEAFFVQSDDINTYQQTTPDGFKLGVMTVSQAVYGNTLLEKIAVDKSVSKFNNEVQVSAVVGKNFDIENKINNLNVTDNLYKVHQYNNSTFINFLLDHDKNSAKEWIWLKNALEQAEDNVFVFLPYINDVKDSLVSKIFRGMLQSLVVQRGKSAFVFYGGDQFICEVSGGVYYFKLPEEIAYEQRYDAAKLTDEASCLILTVNPDSVTYELVRLFENV